MCGISGIAYHSGNVSPSKSPHWGDLLKASTSLKHRGPDDEGYVLFHNNRYTTAYSGDTSRASIESKYEYSPNINLNEFRDKYNCTLIHRRLSIIDLSSAAHEPMCNSTGKIWITYNGEIYNYKELRNELKHKGYQFITTSDTEVIIKAYECWGADCVTHFEGMWAFAIYDMEKNILFASRDRFGVKPFYYTVNNQFLAFASEQKALLQAGWVKFEVNDKAVHDFLLHDKLEHEEESLFKNIIELKPAHSLIFHPNDGRLEKWNYYTLSYSTGLKKYDETAAQNLSKQVQGMVEESVQRRLQSDAKVGSCLSGGIDSSVIVCTINDLLNKSPIEQVGTTQEVFHGSFSNEKYDESKYAAAVAAQTRVQMHTSKPTPADFIKDIEKLCFHQDLPIRSISSYSQYRVMQLAKENNIKVLLDGQGGDELFAGYYRYLPYWMNDVKKAESSSNYRNEKHLYFNDASLRNEFLKYRVKERIKKSLGSGSLQPNSLSRNLLSKELQRRYNKSAYRVNNFNSLNEALAFDFTGGYLKELLYREDRNGMAHGIEARVPFTDDHKLVEFVFGIPGNYKIRKGYSKYLLREAFKTVLPTEVYQRKDKMGFSSPNNEWIEELKNHFRQYITPDLAPYYNLKELDKNFEKYFSIASKEENYKTLKWLMFPVWLSVFKNLG